MRSLLSGQTPVSLITSPEKHNIFFLKKLRGATSSEKWWGPLVLTWLPKDLFIRKLFFFETIMSCLILTQRRNDARRAVASCGKLPALLRICPAPRSFFHGCIMLRVSCLATVRCGWLAKGWQLPTALAAGHSWISAPSPGWWRPV